MKILHMSVLGIGFLRFIGIHLPRLLPKTFFVGATTVHSFIGDTPSRSDFVLDASLVAQSLDDLCIAAADAADLDVLHRVRCVDEFCAVVARVHEVKLLAQFVQRHGRYRADGINDNRGQAAAVI